MLIYMQKYAYAYIHILFLCIIKSFLNMDTPLKQNKATSNLLKIQRKYKEDGTPQKDAITILTKKQICDEVDRMNKVMMMMMK